MLSILEGKLEKVGQVKCSTLVTRGSMPHTKPETLKIITEKTPGGKNHMKKGYTVRRGTFIPEILGNRAKTCIHLAGPHLYPNSIHLIYLTYSSVSDSVGKFILLYDKETVFKSLMNYPGSHMKLTVDQKVSITTIPGHQIETYLSGQASKRTADSS